MSSPTTNHETQTHTQTPPGLSHTHTANRQAFYRHRIIPRMLVDTNKRE